MIGAQANEAMIAGLPPVSLWRRFACGAAPSSTRLFDRTGTVPCGMVTGTDARWLSLVAAPTGVRAPPFPTPRSQV
jgi:hypothetical protein